MRRCGDARGFDWMAPAGAGACTDGPARPAQRRDARRDGRPIPSHLRGDSRWPPGVASPARGTAPPRARGEDLVTRDATVPRDRARGRLAPATRPSTRAFVRRLPHTEPMARHAASRRGSDPQRPRAQDGLRKRCPFGRSLRDADPSAPAAPAPVCPTHRHYEAVPVGLWDELPAAACRSAWGLTDTRGIADDAPGITDPTQLRFDAGLVVDHGPVPQSVRPSLVSSGSRAARSRSPRTSAPTRRSLRRTRQSLGGLTPWRRGSRSSACRRSSSIGHHRIDPVDA